MHPAGPAPRSVGTAPHGAAGRGGNVPAVGTACTDGTQSPTALIVTDDPEQLAALAPDVQPDVIVFDPGTPGQE